jgi:threonylcarbamoyladenosine tRNA methylthiotransferase MtaB
MRRPYRFEEYRRLIRSVKDVLPDAAIGSDIIIGFPGERDEDFERLEKCLSALPLTHLHVFPYSDRPGTAASAMRSKVPGAVIRRRAARIREIGGELASGFRRSQVGRVRSGLTLEDGSLVLTDNYLKVRIPPGRQRNERIDVRITEGNGEVLRGKVLATAGCLPSFQ